MNISIKDLLDIDVVKRIDEQALAKSRKATTKKRHKYKTVYRSTKFDYKPEKKRVGKRIKVTYPDYIKGRGWRRRKKEYYKKYGKLCAVCGVTKSVQLHHLLYEDLGKERDEHLLPLCKLHHQRFHDEVGVQKNMVKATHNFIIGQQEELEMHELSKRL